MPTVIPVRMHFATQDLWFNPRQTGACKGDHVVVTTERGTEFGLVTADAFEAPRDEIKGDLKPVLRVATEEDLALAEDLATKGDEAMPIFRELVKEHELDMKPVGVEFLFGGEKVVFYFAAEDRVDFRDLVRELASHFHQRVDMRQIGVRDEARLVGGYAPCGQELCCVRFGSDFEPVSIRMAKEQDLPLNSSKISGVCGRLMCCLRYEFEAYRDFKQRAPKKNALIDTPLGKAKIVEYNTPRETLRLRLENGKSFVVALKDMTCSEGCCKRSAEQHIPLRPDTVTREALEELGTPDIIMQLAELDRANDPTGGYHLDNSLLEGHRTPRRRGSSNAGTAGNGEAAAQPGTRRSRGQKSGTEGGAAEAERTPRRRGGARANDGASSSGENQRQNPSRRQRKGIQATSGDAAQPTPEQQSRPRGGGMRPRRANKRTEQPNTSAAPAVPRGAAPETTQTPRRARRHHAAAENPAAPTPAPTEQPAGNSERENRSGRTRSRRPSGDGQRSQAQGTRKPRERSVSGENKGQEVRDQSQAQGQGAPRQRRQHHNAPKPRTEGGAPSNNQPRRRRPGDHGGAGAASSSQ